VSAWNWVSATSALAAHREQLAIYGGGDGVRDLGLLESALARPQHLAAYGSPDAAELAASYAFGLARNHPFVDGNKRVALMVCEAFLLKNGFNLGATNSELVPIFLGLAAGELSEHELADWLRERIEPA
jgi:death-on-curing protein